MVNSLSIRNVIRNEILFSFWEDGWREIIGFELLQRLDFRKLEMMNK